MVSFTYLYCTDPECVFIVPEFFVFVFLIGKFVFSDCFVFGYSVFYFAYLAAVGLTCGMWALG